MRLGCEVYEPRCLGRLSEEMEGLYSKHVARKHHDSHVSIVYDLSKHIIHLQVF